ncbi:MAG: hypothetical protein ACKVOU_03675 [Cytophagales bacterium]
MTREQILYSVKEHQFKWCKIHDENENLIFSYSDDAKDTSVLMGKLNAFLDRFQGKFVINFKEKSTSNAECKFTYSLNNGVSQDQEVYQIPQKVDEQAIEKRIYAQIRAEQKIQADKDAFEQLRKEVATKEKELNDWGVKLMSVLEFAGTKLYEKYAPLLQTIINPTNTMALAGTPSETKPLSESDQERVMNAINRALIYLTPTQIENLVSFIEKDPSVIKNPLMSHIFNT